MQDHGQRHGVDGLINDGGVRPCSPSRSAGCDRKIQQDQNGEDRNDGGQLEPEPSCGLDPKHEGKEQREPSDGDQNTRFWSMSIASPRVVSPIAHAAVPATRLGGGMSRFREKYAAFSASTDANGVCSRMKAT